MAQRVSKLVEYKNVTEHEKMYLEIFGEETTRHTIELKPQETVFLSQKDIRYHKNDKRFLSGKIVQVGSIEDMVSTKVISDIMSDEQIHYYIKNVKDIETLKKQITPLKSRTTVERLLKEAKKEEHNKSYNFVITIETKMLDLIKAEDEIYSKKVVNVETK